MFTYMVYKAHKLSFNVLLLTIVAVATDVAILLWLWQGYTLIGGN